MKKTILVMGGTGFLGNNLVTHLAHEGYRLIVKTRNPNARYNTKQVTHIGHFSEIDEHVDVVVHLSGIPLTVQRWSKSFREKIVETRIRPLNNLKKWLNTIEDKPPLLISASSFGYYGMGTTRPSHMYNEDGPAGKDHFADIFIKVEHEALSLQSDFEKIVILRSANVLGLHGHVFEQITKPIELGFTGVYGSGEQPFPWIHQQDWVRAVEFLIENDGGQHSIYNIAAPSMNQQYEFAGLAARYIGKEHSHNIPTILLRSILGERADILIRGNYIEPRNLLEEGFRFRFTDLYDAMDYIY